MESKSGNQFWNKSANRSNSDNIENVYSDNGNGDENEKERNQEEEESKKKQAVYLNIPKLEIK